MTTFLYRGLDKHGHYKAGSYYCHSKSVVNNLLEPLELTNIEIFESKTPYKKNNYSLVSANELSIFCKQISAMFFSYMTTAEGVQLLSEQTDNKVLKTAFIEIHQFMQKGYTFAEAIAMYEHIFGRYLVQMTSIGEHSGNLDIVYKDLSDYFEKEHEIRKRIKGAIIYPVTLSIMTFFIFIYMIKSVLPLFNTIFESIGATQSPILVRIIEVNSFLDKYLLMIVFSIIVIVGWIYIYFSSEKGQYKFDKLKATLPYVSYITKRIATARFSRSLSMMLKSGVDIYNALNQSIILISNIYLLEKFQEVNEKVKNGGTLTNALVEVDVFPALFVKMVTIGERTGNLDEMLEKTTAVYEAESYTAIEKATKLIEPILITFLAIILGFVLLTIMVPMITIMNAM